MAHKGHLVSFWLALAGPVLAPLCWSQVPPEIQLTAVPAYGAWPGVIAGRVVGVASTNYRIAALVFVSGLGFYSKPYCSATTSALAADGTFSVLLTTGGIDNYATLIALLVVPATASVPCYAAEAGIPLELEQQAIAKRLVPRPNPAQRTVQFAGETWIVKSAPAPVGPGPNYFSDSAENVWVDSAGRLHLRITFRNGRWNCAEIYSNRLIGYGTYSFQIDTVPQLDKNVVFGGFSWADAERIDREVDMLELGRFGNAGDPNNAQNVIQPYTTAGNQMRFVLPNVAPTSHSMIWEPNRLFFRSSDALGGLLHEWTYPGQPPTPDSARLNFRFNLWLFAPPSDGNEAEVVVSGFSFAPAAAVFVPVTPCRLEDTRISGGTVQRAQTHDVQVAGVCGIPAAARSYSVNVTAVPSGPLGYITVWPTGQAQPLASTLNSLDGRVKANASITPAGSGGSISIYTTDPSDFVVDINGYFTPLPGSAGGAFYPVTPCRVMDTRNPVGPLGGPSLAASEPRTIPVGSGPCSIPSTASAYSLNYTAVPKGPLGYISTWPTGSPMPLVSTLNAPTGMYTANAAIVPVGANGSVDVYATDSTDLVVDINGYFASPGAPGALSFFTVTPCRALDTRNPVGVLGGPSLNGSRDFPISASACGVPAAAMAYSLNATVLPTTTLGYLTLWPWGGPMPLASTLNALDGSYTSNAAIVPAANGGISGYASDATELILDINGYFAP